MRLTVLGCAGSVGGPGVACSGYLIENDGEQPVMLECGPGSFGELMRYVNPNDVAIMLSHLHADHCLDIPAMLVWRRYAPPEPATTRALLYGPEGTALRLGAAASEHPGRVDDISDTFDVREWTDEVVTVGGMTVEAMAVDHVPHAYGLRITGPQGQILAFSGDTAPCDALIDIAADADLFLCEASWTHAPSERPPHLHLSGIEAGEAATKANARRLAVTHVAPWSDRDAIYAEARQTFAGPVDMVVSGQVFDI